MRSPAHIAYGVEPAPHDAATEHAADGSTVGVPQPGEILDGKYRIEGMIGQGGMAVVLAAIHLHLEERVAIKVLLPQWAEDPEFVERFMREGRSAIKIRSEHVVRVLDVGVVEGRPYLVMEYLEGSDLDQLLAAGGPLPVHVAIDYLLQACEAIAEAHASGIIHRDLKPANLFLTHRADGSPAMKVLDFGISKLMNSPRSSGVDMRTTQPSMVMGSPHYMSPEQMASARDVDERTDIWALGAILHELLAGAPPFKGETITALCATILKDPPAKLTAYRADVPLSLEAIIARCLQKDPAARFANVADLAFALADYGSPSARASAERIRRVLDAVGDTQAAAPRSVAPAPQRSRVASLKDSLAPPPKRGHVFGYVVGSLALVVVGSGIGYMIVQNDRAAHASLAREEPVQLTNGQLAATPASSAVPTPAVDVAAPATGTPVTTTGARTAIGAPAAAAPPSTTAPPPSARLTPPASTVTATPPPPAATHPKPAASPKPARGGSRGPRGRGGSDDAPLPSFPVPSATIPPDALNGLLPPTAAPAPAPAPATPATPSAGPSAAPSTPDGSSTTGSDSMPMRRLASLVAAPLLFLALDARAAEPAAAQALFNEGKQLMTAGRYAEACPKLEESQRLDPGMGTLFHLAECDEHVGKTASAWAAYLEVAAQAKLAAQPAREKVARERAAALEPKLGRLTIAAPVAGGSAGGSAAGSAAGGAGFLDGLEVRRDGVLIGKAQWGTALPVDPGDHVVVASAPGRRTWQGSARVEPAKAQSITIPVLEPAPAPVAAAAPAAAPAPASTVVAVTPGTTAPAAMMAPTEDATRAPSGVELGPQRVTAIVLGGVGLVGLGVGTYFGLSSKGKHDDAAAHCTGNACDAEGVSLRDDAITRGNVSTVAFVLGAAAIAGGAVVWLTAPPVSREGTRVGVSPSGITMRGAF